MSRKLNSLLKHRPGTHPVIKRKYDFSKDEYAWYWIYLTSGEVFNTYEWYVESSGPLFTIWKNMYYGNDPNGPVIRIKNRWIKKVVCWKVNKPKHPTYNK